MKNRMLAGICLAAACASLAAPAVAAKPVRVLTEETRAAVPAGAVHVLVAQSEVASDINPSNIAVYTGGGLLGGLLAAHQNAERAKKAERLIAPIREALGTVDADALAIDTTKAAFASVPWLQAAPVEFSKDTSPLGKSGLLDKAGGPQGMFVQYTYDFSPDFSSIRVVALVEVAYKAVAAKKKPESRFSPKRLAYARSVTSIVSIPGATDDKEANAALWVANGGEPARNGLNLAFGEVQKLLPRTLALTAAEIQAMSDKAKQKAEAAGFTGRVQDADGDSTLLWADGFIQVQTLR